MVISHSSLVLAAAIVSFLITVALVLISKQQVIKGNEKSADYINRVMIVIASATFMLLIVWVGTSEQASSM